MPDVRIKSTIWDGLKSAAAARGEKPEALANRALKEFLARMADEKLLENSAATARRAPLRISDTEAAIRRYRKRA